MAALIELSRIPGLESRAQEIAGYRGISMYRVALPRLMDTSCISAISTLLNMSIPDFMEEMCKDECEIQVDGVLVQLLWSGRRWIGFTWENDHFTFEGNFQ